MALTYTTRIGGAINDVDALLLQPGDDVNVVLISSRALHILQNLALIDVHFNSRYVVERLGGDLVRTLEETDSDYDEVVSIREDISRQLVPVEDYAQMISVTATQYNLSQPVPNQSHQKLEYTTVDQLPDGFVSISSHQFTVLTQRKIEITCSVTWDVASSGLRQFRVLRNGTVEYISRTLAIPSFNPTNVGTFSRFYFVGDVIEVQLWQNSGAQLNVYSGAGSLSGTQVTLKALS